MLVSNKYPTGGNVKTSSVLSVLMTLALAGGVAGCGKSEEGMGPAQKVGQKLDNAGDQVARDVQDKLDRANAAAQQAASSAERTKENIAAATAEAASDASKGLNKATEEVGKKVERAGEKIQESAKSK